VRVLVTGHKGYIGAVVVPVLVDAGHDVVGLDTCYFDDSVLEGREDEIPTLRLDVRDARRQDLEGFDAVVHLAALSNDPLGDLDPVLTDEINYAATVQFADAAKRAGVRRFVFASSCSMYGAVDGDEAVDEAAPLQPLTPYAASKVRSERALSGLADSSFSPTFMRNATAYGASPRFRVDLVLNNLAAWAHTTGAIRLLSDGTAWRPLVHVEDIGRSTLAILEAPIEAVHDEAFNIGAPSENYRVRELAEVVQEASPDCTIEFAAGGGKDLRSYRVGFDKFARAFPAFEFRWTAMKGAAELLSALERTGFTLEDFTGHRFTRLAALKRLLAEGAVTSDLRWAVDPAPLLR
jgi:nucleoside-diphosphate-sugar epimerase